MLIGGEFTNLAGQPRAGIAGLLANASIDPSFTPAINRQRLRRGDPVAGPRRNDGEMIQQGNRRDPADIGAVLRTRRVGECPACWHHAGRRASTGTLA